MPHDGGRRPPSSGALDPEDIATCTRVLEGLLERPDLLTLLPPEERRRLVIAAGRVSRPERHEKTRITKAFRRYRKRSEMAADRAVRESAQIRHERLKGSPAGALLSPPLAANMGEPHVLPWADPHPSDTAPRELERPRSCYVCKESFTQLHFFYDSMCPGCASLNYQKRFQTADLKGRVALITGARIKIGYHASLMLLRAGAEVIATTRFPHDAARRYAKEPDYATWSERLTLYGLDLRHCPSVERFATHLLETRSRLDFLLNNAAQTVHRPAGFYQHLWEVEARSLDELPEAERTLVRTEHRLALPERGESSLSKAAALALTSLHPDEALDPEHFPRGQFDPDGQQLDLRETNSWRLRAHEVDTPELIEVHLVNAIAPFILCSRLKELMLRTANRDKHVVNVSAMEGCFARNTKTEKHPHTNMAKASLNMLTRTSAQDYLKDGIHMNSVDTGWITDEDPFHHAVRKRTDYDFHPPLDAIDGAARICDPIFRGFLTGEHPSGLFFKDYGPTGW